MREDIRIDDMQLIKIRGKNSVETVMTNKLNELKEKRRLKTEQLEWLFF